MCKSCVTYLLKCYFLYPGVNMQQCLAVIIIITIIFKIDDTPVTLQYKFNFLQLRRWYLQLKFILCLIKYKIKHKIVKNWQCDVTWSLPPPPVTNCHTFSDPYPLGAWHTLWMAPILQSYSVKKKGEKDNVWHYIYLYLSKYDRKIIIIHTQ